MKRSSQDILNRISWFILVALYLYQFYLICTYSVDIPFKDEWLYLKPGYPLSLPEKLTLSWLFARVSEHTIVMTNVMTWINFKLFGLDFFKQKIINYMLFGVLLYAIIRFKDSILGKDSFRMFPAFLFFLLSPVATENHSWAFQSQIHLVLIFFTLMLIYMKSERLAAVETVIFIAVSVLAIYSFAAGVVLALLCLIFRNLHIVSLIAAEKVERRTGLIHIAASIVIIGGFIAIWFKGYKKPDYIPPGVWPSEMAFWDYFLNMLSFGFGFDTQNMLIGAFLLAFALLPALLLLANTTMRLDLDVLCTSAAILAVLAVMVSISFGRASIGDAKTSRYVEISFMLIPFISMAWWLLLKRSPAKNLILSLLWTSCFCSYLDNWPPNLYREAYFSDKNTLDCISNYFKHSGDAACQEYWITPAHLENAKRLKIHFIQSLKLDQP